MQILMLLAESGPNTGQVKFKDNVLNGKYRYSIYIYLYKRNETKNYPTPCFMQRVQSSGV